MDVADPNSDFYKWENFMNRKDHLDEKEIQRYEQLSSPEIGAVFCQIGVAKGAQLFTIMLASYRMASRVANAAWDYVKALDSEDVDAANAAMTRMRRALSDYAPSYFSPHTSDLEFTAACFEQFYEEACTKETREEVEELIFTWTKRIHDQLRATGPRTPPREMLEAIVREHKLQQYLATKRAPVPE